MIEFTDRYKALGIPYPDPQTMCKGQCEGIGYYPTQRDGTVVEIKLWDEVHAKETEKCDGWHFIKCPDCEGSGKSKSSASKGE